MKNRIFYIILFVIIFHFNGYNQNVKLITFNLETLNKLKMASIHDDDIKKARTELLRTCEDILVEKRKYSVTANSSSWPLAKRNDYTSNGRYWWPNPKTKDGLPYIRIDGKTNRYSQQISDKPIIDGLAKDIIHLGVGYFYTKDERYVKWATVLLNHFFVNTKTRMNPNFNFSQVVPGEDESIGSIMESVVFIDVIEGIQLMKDSHNFSKALNNSLKIWFTEYLNWLEESPKGKVNAKHINNRGTYYTLLRCDIAMFLEDTARAKDIFKNEAFLRVTDQISSDGLMKKEISRAVPLGYVKYNLSGFKQLNEIGNKLGFDLLNYRGPNGENLKNAFDWLNKYRSGDAIWNYSDERGITSTRALRMKEHEENVVRFSVERFGNYLQELTYIKTRNLYRP